MSQPTRKEILALITAYFLLNHEEQEALIAAIYEALRDSMIAAYNWNTYLIGITLDYLPTSKQEKLLSDLANERGKQISATYEREILAATTLLLDAYEKANNGSLDGVVSTLRETLKDYTDARTAQKAEDISKFEVGEGADTGTDLLIDDISNADEGDNVYVDEADLYIGVLPYGGLCDLCDEWGGEMVTISEASSIPSMPNHNHCEHYKTFIDMRDEAA